MSTIPVELVQFPFSHFNEKARWALDWKKIPHRRRSLLPGPHMPTVRRMTGQTATPVLRLGDAVVHGSSRILEALEEHQPEPALFPEDPAQRAAVGRILQHFDDVVGPQVRCALFSRMLGEADYLCGTFAGGRSRATRTLYRATFPLVKGLIARGNGVTGPEAVAAAYADTEAALDRVAAEVAGTGHLVGDRFSAADLTAAALLAPCANPDHPDMRRPEPRPPAIDAWLERWAGHPAVAWVHETYRRHRPPTAAMQ
jgi:glutathione S-transferase